MEKREVKRSNRDRGTRRRIKRVSAREEGSR